ncbi:MAG: hypothetical protein NVV70_01840 [Cellulomonas sp.]|uniref:hypothetical protein n=1 Tax=unclassified Cellulomonas TaxID=2620175 RepID=UPI0012E27D0A|nr:MULTISPECIES: hypothetical protein [unclassified Cellulomonas]MCR6646932.1 hypothetical protein [Cellulomonas sp.]MCR6706266.1 hypothetical protein [Cellulomonas sp.]
MRQIVRALVATTRELGAGLQLALLGLEEVEGQEGMHDEAPDEGWMSCGRAADEPPADDPRRDD